MAFIAYSFLISAQCNTDCVSRGLLAGLIYEQVYSQNNPDNYQPMASYPTAYIDNTGNVELDKKISLVSYLDYGDGVRVLGHMDSGGYLLTQGSVSRGEAVVAILEAWDISPDFTGNVSYNDVGSNHEYYGYINEAEDLGLLSNVFSESNFYSDLSLTQNELIRLIVNITNTSYHPVSNSELLDEDNYFTPNNYQPNNIGFLRGLEQGVFSHYAKNSFVIPDRKLNLNFSHYYSTQLVELPQSYFPIEPLGRGWTHTYNSYIVRESTFNAQTGVGTYHYNIKWADGSIDIYDIDASEYLTLGIYDQLSEIGSGNKISIYKKSGVEYIFERLDSDKEIFYLTKIKELNSNEINIEYEQSDVDNDFERIEWVESPTGKKLHFYYHNNTDLINYIKDPINRQIRFTYNDDLERLKRFYDAKNQNTRYYYLASDDDVPDEHRYKQYLLRKILLPRGNKIEAEYDEDDDGKLVSYQVNDNIATEIVTDYSDYTAITSTVTVPMPNSGDTQDYIYEFDANGMVSQFQNNNQNINISYPNPTDNNPLLPTNLDVNGLDIDYTYDDDGNVKSIKVENNENEDFWYDNDHNFTHYRDENNNDTYFTYDTRKNLTSIEDALGNTINFTYSFYGELLSVTNQEGITVDYTYNNGVVTSITAPEGLSSSFSYDEINRLLSQTINGQTSSFAYDPNDNLTSQTNIGGLTTTFNYDQNDNLITITNANGINTSFTYNNEDQVTSETFGSLVKQYKYNDDGTLDKYIKPSGQEIKYDYLSNGKFNGAGTITDVDYFGSSKGKKEGLISSIASDEIRYNFDYDNINRLDKVEIDSNQGKIVHYDYDNVGNIIKITYPNFQIDLEVIYTYDAKNRMTKVNLVKNGITSTIAEYVYRDDDLKNGIHYGNGVIADYHYDDAGRTTGITYAFLNGSNSGQYLFSEKVDLDVKGNIISEKRDYRSLDTSSNFAVQNNSYEYNSNNHLTSLNNQTQTVNNDGNTVSKIVSITNVSGIATTNYQYDIDDKLTNVALSGSTMDYNFNYEYDAYGNRTRKEYVGGTLTKTYIWDIINNNVLVETFSANIYQNGYHIYGATGLEATVYPNSNGVTYYIGDLRGSVVTTIREGQTYQPFYKYDDFGRVVSGDINSTESSETFKYLGKHGITTEHAVTGHYYIKARHYDAKLGRFLTQDPIWSTNLYPYADNNPISRIDKNGNYWETALDVASLGESGHSLYNDPSLTNAGFFFWDFMAVFTPVPGSYLAKGGKYAAKYGDEIAQLGRGVDAFWGKVFNYKNGGQMSAIEHINFRHAFNTGFKNVSKFSQNTSAKVIKSYVDEAVKYGNKINGGYEYNFGKVIGFDKNGNSATSIRVFIQDGWVRTAFPF